MLPDVRGNGLVSVIRKRSLYTVVDWPATNIPFTTLCRSATSRLPLRNLDRRGPAGPGVKRNDLWPLFQLPLDVPNISLWSPNHPHTPTEHGHSSESTNKILRIRKPTLPRAGWCWRLRTERAWLSEQLWAIACLNKTE